MIANEPTLAEVKEWLRLTDDIDDEALQEGLQAAVAYQRRSLRFPSDPLRGGVYYPDDLRLACFMRTARWLARRSSPEGLVGFGDFGPAQVPYTDRDVQTLEANFRPPVIA
jgi:hypothetical protein